MPRIISVDVEQVGPSTGRAGARTHTVFVDRPLDNGGGDIEACAAGSTLLISLGGCFLSTLLAAVKTRDAEVSNVRVSVVGTIDGSPERFESMAMRVTATYADDDLMRKLIAIAERGCLVSNTLKDAVPLAVHRRKDNVIEDVRAVRAILRIAECPGVFIRLDWNCSTGCRESIVHPGDSCPQATHSRYTRFFSKCRYLLMPPESADKPLQRAHKLSRSVGRAQGHHRFPSVDPTPKACKLNKLGRITDFSFQIPVSRFQFLVFRFQEVPCALRL